MSPRVRRLLAGLLMIAGLQRPGLAEPPAVPPAPTDPDVTPRAPSPWLDLAPSEVLAKHATPTTTDEDSVKQPDHKVAAALTLGGLYAGFAGWTYLAWYRKHKALGEFKWGGDGWVGPETYAGGADKGGHAWATMGLGRAGSQILKWGGYDPLTSAIVGVGLSELLFFFVEVKDGFYYEFSFSDLTGDSIGAALAFVFEMWPQIDEMFDYKVQYWPSHQYLKVVEGNAPCPTGGCSRFNIAEDYSGETYLLSFHLNSIKPLRESKYFWWTRYIDLAVGYDSRNYKPAPDPAEMLTPHQSAFFGVTFNAQELCDELFKNHSTTRKITHGFFEIFNLPYSTLPLIKGTRVADKPPASDGA